MQVAVQAAAFLLLGALELLGEAEGIDGGGDRGGDQFLGREVDRVERGLAPARLDQ